MPDETLADKYRAWLKNFPKEPAARIALATAAIDAFERCEERGTTTDDDLAQLVEAASASPKLVFEVGCHLLVKLAHRHEEAQACLLQMSQDKRADARFHAVAYLNSDLPEPLRWEIVERALQDRGVKVRQKGIERAEQFGFKQFLPRLMEMQRTETHAGVLESLELHIPLLKDGYWLRPNEDGSAYRLTVRHQSGIAGRSIPKEQFSEEFVREEVARLRQRRF